MTWFMSREFLEKLDLRSYDAAAIARRLDMEVDVVRRFVAPLRRYTVQTSGYGWLAGKGNDRPALVFTGKPRLSGGDQDPLNAVLFEPDGSVRTQAIRCDDSIFDDEEVLLDLAGRLLAAIAGPESVRAPATASVRSKERSVIVAGSKHEGRRGIAVDLTGRARVPWDTSVVADDR